MNKISCIIVDDELRACQYLAGLLGHFPDVEIIGSFTNPNIGRLAVMEKSPDLVFLDIDMPGLSGLEFLDSLKLNGSSSKFVFVTGHENYSIDALRKNAFDYLLKPLSLDTLMEMICRYKGQVSKKLSPKDLCYGKLRFNTLQGFFLLELSDIVYIEADGNYSMVHLKDGTNRLITLNLGHIEDRLAGFSFFRMDRSLIINIKYLNHINRKDHLCTINYNDSIVEFSVNRIRIKQLVELF